MHRRSFASEGTLPKAVRRVRKRVRGNAEAWVSTLQAKELEKAVGLDAGRLFVLFDGACRRENPVCRG